MNKLFLAALLLMMAMLLVVGCSKEPTQPDETISTLNLVDEFGGYSATSEAPAFGDGNLQDDDEGEVEFDDPILSSLSVDSIVNDPEAGLFHFRAVWGQLEFDSTVSEVTDWTGSLTISRGAEIIRRVIRFEQNDEILPRNDRKLIEWNSFTTVHNDGIAVDLIIPRPIPTLDSTAIVDSMATTYVVDTVWPDPVTVEFKTGPYSRTFTLGEIAALDTIVTLDDSNAIAFHGIQFYRNACPRGFLGGHWGFDDEGNGVFRGRWTDPRGRIIGHLQGHFGIDENGNNLFFGKWVDITGRFEGFVKGSWKWRPCLNANPNAFTHAGGEFRGMIFDGNRNPIGKMGGRFGKDVELRKGFFQGRWKLNCDRINDDATDDKRPDNGKDTELEDGFDNQN